MLLIEHQHLCSGIWYLDLKSSPGDPYAPFSPIGIVTRSKAGTVGRRALTDIPVRFVSDRGEIRIVHYYKPRVLRQLWQNGTLTQPTYEAFMTGNRIMTTSAGILLGLLPINRR